MSSLNFVNNTLFVIMSDEKGRMQHVNKVEKKRKLSVEMFQMNEPS